MSEKAVYFLHKVCFVRINIYSKDLQGDLGIFKEQRNIASGLIKETKCGILTYVGILKTPLKC